MNRFNAQDSTDSSLIEGAHCRNCCSNIECSAAADMSNRPFLTLRRTRAPSRISTGKLKQWLTSSSLFTMSPHRTCCYSGFHFLCSKLWTVADASSFALKLCRMLEKICRGVPSSPISKRIKKGSSFPRKSAQFISPICGGNFGVLQSHKSTVYSRSFDMSRSTDGVQ